MEEDGKWTFIEPLETGDIVDSGHSAMFRGGHYSLKQEVQAKVDYVIGEFYWKVEIGETVQAAELAGPGGKLSREKSRTEVSYSFVSPLDPQELAAFGVAPPASPGGVFGLGDDDDGESSGSMSQIVSTMIAMVIICLVLAIVSGGGCGGVGGSSFGGTSGGWGK
jgi:hypothetical protein